MMTGSIRNARLLPMAAVAVVGIAGCGRAPSSTSAAAAQAAPAAAPTVEVVHVIQRAVDLTMDLPGELDPYETVAVFPKVTGFVKTIRVDRGSRVRAGERLADLEAPELVSQRAEAQSKLQAAQAQLAAVTATLEAATSTYDKLKAASSTPGVVAGNDLVLAEKTLEGDRDQIAAAQQNVEAARQALNAIAQMQTYLDVTAPFDGIVTERNVHPGTLVGPSGGPGASTPLLRVVDDRRLRLVVPVPEAYVAGVPNGRTVSFSVSSYPGQIFTGNVARLAGLVDAKTRTMPVELDVDNRDGRLAPGVFCQVRWPVRRPAPSLFVPARSVASTTGRTFVVRVRNGRTEWIDVKTGLSSGALIEVFGALESGDAVASRGTDELRAGTPVRTAEAKTAS